MAPAPTHIDQTDEALMARVQADDADAFGRLYDRHAERALRIARAICRDGSRAEDAVQEGFLAIWRHRAAYRPDAGSFQTWSMRIVKNRAIDSSRHLAIGRPPQADDLYDRPRAGPVSTTPQDEVIARSQRDELLGSLRHLPQAQAEVIVLAFYGELSHSEIAERLDLPPGTVKGRMRLGLEKLRREMGVSSGQRTPETFVPGLRGAPVNTP